MTNGLDYKVTWQESPAQLGRFPKEVLFQYPYAREPEREALVLAEQLAETDIAEDIKIQRRVVSDWMECIGI